MFYGENRYRTVTEFSGLDAKFYPSRVCGPGSFAYQMRLPKRVLKTAPDVCHVHGMWTYLSIAALRLQNRGVPYVVSPHGMLDTWALQKSAWKKSIVSAAYEHKFLQAATCIHALCQGEYESIRAYGLRNPVAIIPNGAPVTELLPVTAPAPWANIFHADKRILLYFGRLHEKKNLVALLQAFADVKNAAEELAGKWVLVIAGWGDEDYTTLLKRETDALELNRVVHFLGGQFGNQKELSLRHADALILPSLSEGLPMVVLEAWSYGVPVVLTPQCNLGGDIRGGAGVEMTASREGIADGLIQLMRFSDLERRAMGERGKDLVRTKYYCDSIGAKMRDVYRWAAGRADAPECVVFL